MVSAHNHQGELIWEKDSSGQGGHGFGVSPIVHGDLDRPKRPGKSEVVSLMDLTVQLEKFDGKS